MRFKYNRSTDSLGIFFSNDVPKPLFEEDYEPGLLILSDEAHHFVGVSIRDASTQMPAKDKWTYEEALLWLHETYPRLLEITPNKIRLNERAIHEHLVILESYKELKELPIDIIANVKRYRLDPSRN
jgi:hypothetical protein